MTQAFSLVDIQTMTEPDSVSDDPRAGRVRAGGMLREAREAAGKSASELATQLKVSIDKIQALESGDWDRLPDPAFARALLRAAAKALKADAHAIVGALPPLHPLPAAESLDAAPVRKPMPVMRQGSAYRKLWWLAVGVIVMAALLIFFLPTRDDLSHWLPPLVLNQQASPPVPMTHASMPEPVRAESAAASAVMPMQPALPAASAAAITASAPAAQASQAAGEAAPTLDLQASAESWIQVASHQGKILFAGIVPAGGSQSVPLTQHDLPIQLVVGNAAHTQVRFEGQQVSMTVPPNSNVARLTLPKP